MENGQQALDPTACLHAALAAAPALRWPSPERDRLWLAVQDAVCTRGRAWACPMGSTTPQEVGGEDARHVELLGAMSWLVDHERDARLMDLHALFRILRGVAVRGKNGSARTAQADALHGMTGVAAGRPVTFASELETLGRGLRLAFGVHTGIELLDTVEVLAHERYEALLKNAGVLNEQFIDRRTRSVLSTTPDGKTVVASEDDDVNVLVIADYDSSSTAANTTSQTPEPAMVAATTGAAALESLEERTSSLGKQVSELETLQTYVPNPDRPPILVPVLRMTKVQANFSLADIVDLDPFVKLGKQIAADPEDQLRRVKVSAKIITGPDGLRRTELVTRAASDKLEASTTLLPLQTLRAELIDAVLGAPVVPQRADQARAVQPLIDAFFEGLSQDKAVHLLSAYGPRAAARLVALVTTQQRQYQSAPSFEDVVTVTPLGRPRSSMRRQVMNPHEPFSKQAAYDSWNKSFYGFDWFDSEPERRVATIVDDSDAVASWVRLQIGEVPILWRSDGREYNADLIVVETAGKHWVVEIKADNAIPSEEVQAKRTAAKRWVQHVNAATVTGTDWGYLLVSQTDIDQCQGSWSALKALGT